MSYDQTSYVAKLADANGLVAYTDEENAVWQELMARQNTIVQGRACDEYLQGLALLNFPTDKVPQCKDISTILQDTTGWSLEPVPALIPFDRFFQLLANRQFPAATFIRTKEELDYLKEPDIFHEMFGHCPLLTNSAYADFTQLYGQLGLSATPEERVLLARLFWFTIEFGLIQTPKGLRAYGGGILSSINETVYCLESTIPQRKPFNVIEALKTPYRIDEIQPVYFVLNTFDELYHLIDIDLMALIRQVRDLGKNNPLHPC
jgi:phenylalanine-4-hydroxylase